MSLAILENLEGEFVAPVIGDERAVDRLDAVSEASAIPAIFLDCGTEDALIDQSRALRAALTRLGHAPTYAEWPGAHDWAPWKALWSRWLDRGLLPKDCA